MAKKERTLTLETMREVMNLQFEPGKMHDGSVGFELEIWPFRKTAKQGAELVRLYDDEGHGSVQLLQTMEGRIPGLRYAPTPYGLPRFEIGKGGQITFEPGGQIEYSGPPLPTLAEAIADLAAMIEELRCKFKAHDIWLFHSGLNPWHTVEEIGQNLRASRYENMDRYLGSRGPYGQRMMRQSTSLQLNIDTGEPDVVRRRWLAANLVAPIFSAMFGNSPFVDGKFTGAYSFRSVIWQNMDPTRTGFPEGLLAAEYCPCPSEQYLAFARGANCLWLPTASGEYRFEGTYRSFDQWLTDGFHGLYPDIDDWKTHLSTLFPEVRVRGFLEVRYIDAQSKVWCAVPAILLAQLLYSEKAREQVIEWLMPHRPNLPALMHAAAYKGLDDDDLAGLADRIYRLALSAMDGTEGRNVAELCERFFQLYTYRRLSPGAELARLNGGEVFTPEQYREYDNRQVGEAGHLLQVICDYC